MRLIYLLATLTALLGLACQIGRAVVDIKVSAVRMYETSRNNGNHVVGGSGGAYREFWACYDGETMSRIEAWVGREHLIALKITFAGGIVWSVGTPESPGTKHEIFQIRRGEYLTSLSIWEGIERDRVGAISFRTNQRIEGVKIFPFGKFLGTEHTFEVYSGILCGMYGRFGSDVDAVGFYFLKEVKSAELRSVKYSNPLNGPSHSVKIFPESDIRRNHCPEKKSFRFNRDITFTDCKSWQQAGTEANAFRSKIGLKDFKRFCILGRPPIFDAKSEFGWSDSDENSERRIDAETTTRKETVKFSFDAPPKSQTRATAMIVQDTLNLRFEGLWTITFQDETFCEFDVNGIYHSVCSRSEFIKSIIPVVTCSRIKYPLTWTKCTPLNYPMANARGHDPTGVSFYVGRGTHGDRVIPGKFLPMLDSFIYSYKSKVHTSKDFELLTVDPARVLWMPVAGDFKTNTCPEDHVLLPGGHDEKGNTYYIGRTYVGGGQNVGYTGSHMSKLEYTVFNLRTKSGVVLTTGNYEILCVQAGYELMQVTADEDWADE